MPKPLRPIRRPWIGSPPTAPSRLPAYLQARQAALLDDEWLLSTQILPLVGVRIRATSRLPAYLQPKQLPLDENTQPGTHILPRIIWVPSQEQGTTCERDTLIFLVDSETLVDAGDTGLITFGYSAGDGQDDGGAAVGCITISNSSCPEGVTKERMHSNPVVKTWESFGVPSGATVKTAQLVSYYDKVPTGSVPPGGVTESYGLNMRFVDAGYSPAIAGDLLNTTVVTTPPGGPGSNVWYKYAGIYPRRSVFASDSASNTPISFEIERVVTAIGGAGTSWSERLDTILLEICYIGGSGPGRVWAAIRIEWPEIPQDLSPVILKRYRASTIRPRVLVYDRAEALPPDVLPFALGYPIPTPVTAVGIGTGRINAVLGDNPIYAVVGGEQIGCVVGDNAIAAALLTPPWS